MSGSILPGHVLTRYLILLYLLISSTLIHKELLCLGAIFLAGNWQDQSGWALLRLDRSLGEVLGYVPLATGQRASVGMPVVHAGYRYDRQEVLTVQHGCFITGIYDRKRLLRSNCQSGYGDSGGPLLLKRDGQWYVLRLHSVRAGKSASFAVAARVYSGLWSEF
ncbi:hypothetical protein [Aliamphritea spongicola]|nr:hypothetical protein [Aliamphritea spongicola]